MNEQGAKAIAAMIQEKLGLDAQTEQEHEQHLGHGCDGKCWIVVIRR